MYISLKDVASRAGVSFQTASKVLNGRPGVAAPATAERIRAAAQELGYVPNGLARGWREAAHHRRHPGRRPRRRGAVPLRRRRPSRAGRPRARGRPRGDPPGDRRRRIAAQSARAPGRRAAGHRSDAGTEQQLQRCAARRTAPGQPQPSAGHLGRAARLRPPGHGQDRRRAPDRPRSPSDCHGHRSTAAAGRPAAPRRLPAVLDEAGIDLPIARVERADWSAGDGYLATARIIDRDPTVTAIFVHSDEMAVGALRLLADRKIDVPECFSIIGCDDLPLSEFLVPSLTTIHVPFTETGARAAAVLLDLIAGRNAPRRELLPVHLVERESTGPPPRSRGRPRTRPHLTTERHHPRQTALRNIRSTPASTPREGAVHMNNHTSHPSSVRRGFLGGALALGAGALGLSACSSPVAAGPGRIEDRSRHGRLLEPVRWR